MIFDRALTWLWLDSGPGNSVFNMAMDAALLQAAASNGKPVLRFYGWTEPAASFGYSQKILEIESLTHLRPLVRRPTGGGLVPHDADWTYSVIVPPDSAGWYSLCAEESYRCAHEWLRLALGKMGWETNLAQCCRKVLPGQCFEGYEKFDVLWHERKIAGAAQRRTNDGLLIQGSVQPLKPGLARPHWKKAMLIVAADQGVAWEQLMPSPALIRLANDLVTEKFGNSDFIRRH